MADQYQSTDRRTEDTNPETARLLLEGIYTFTTGQFAAVTGGFLATTSIDITSLNDLGNRLKSTGPETLEAKVWRTSKITPGGQIDDYFYPLPYITFNNRSTGEVDTEATYNLQNTFVTAGSIYASYLTLSMFARTAPTRDISFSYKIYSTIYHFDDVA